ncbi:MAG TPA: hypothetical protein VKR06_22095 [Ktedonosporobacter sp.]|nr:hypothetical protein [Ktedonosporobacter sp.]
MKNRRRTAPFTLQGPLRPLLLPVVLAACSLLSATTFFAALHTPSGRHQASLLLLSVNGVQRKV